MKPPAIPADFASHVRGDRLLTEEQAGLVVSLPASKLKKMRMKNSAVRGPRWVTIGKLVRYSLHDLQAWIDLLPRSQ